MPPTRCTAIKADGTQCQNKSSYNDGLCGIHHNVEARRAEAARIALIDAEMAHAEQPEPEPQPPPAPLPQAPVPQPIFTRDPEGGIDLKAFSTDAENVHRSSVQTTTSVGISVLMKRHVLEDQQTLAEIIPAIYSSNNIRFLGNSGEVAISELTNDYYTTRAFGHGYNQVLDRVWTYIVMHSESSELIRRLVQEICEGVYQCTNGKMARLINVLWGYDEELMDACQAASAAPKEAFQAKFSMLRGLPVIERVAAAHAVFEEYKIAEAERAAWLEPLMAWEGSENQMILEEA
jgi:hypothetical protein